MFVPVLLAGPLAGWADFLTVGLGFVIFCLLASAGYVVADLLGTKAEWEHHAERPPVRERGLGVVLLLVLAAALLALMPVAFLPAVLAYFVGTLAYSFVLKPDPLLDVLALAGLFTVRVLAGAMVLAAPVSFWLLTFSMFLFLSLAFAKQYDERARATETVPASDSNLSELSLLLALGAATAVAANVIFVIYLVLERFPSGIYDRPQWLWLLFPLLLLWMMRFWRLVVQGRMHEDPILFVCTDRLSLGFGCATLGLVLLAR